MTLEETMQARFDALLESDAANDQAAARAALLECNERYGEDACQALLLRGSITTAVMFEIANGSSREAVGMKFAGLLGGNTPH